MIPEKDQMILAKDYFVDLDCYKTQRNNNVLVVGTSGSGKTRSIVIPNILQATGSYVISDPKGSLYQKYAPYLKKQGYKVKKLDFVSPEESIKYNFFHYIHSEKDIVKASHMLIGSAAVVNYDPYWNYASELYLSALIAYLYYHRPEEERNLHTLLDLFTKCAVSEWAMSPEDERCEMDDLIDAVERRYPESFAVSQYKKARANASKTILCVINTVQSKLGLMDCKEVARMLSKDEVDITSLGREKTALFVVVSDTERSMDNLANIFFSQCMSELCLFADKKCEDNRLPVDVRFILDDFATNVVIDEFPRMISSIRSRGISAMLMIQAESQLSKAYKDDASTIIGNCDTYVYLGGNDVETSTAISKRCNLPLEKILYMPVGTNWIFRRGERPFNGVNFDLASYTRERTQR